MRQAWNPFRHFGPGVGEPDAPARLRALQLLLAVVMGLGYFLLASVRVEDPARPVFDEGFHARSGALLAEGLVPAELSHPPLVKDAVAVSLLLTARSRDVARRDWRSAGGEPFPSDVVRAWRLPSRILGAWGVAVTCWLGVLVTGSLWLGAAAAALLAVDGCYFVHARVAQTNVFEASLVLTATACAWRAVNDRAAWLLAAGLAIGLALASRWSALAPWALLGGWLAWQLRGQRARGLLLAGAWLVVPAVVYVLAWLPVLAVSGAGPGPGGWWQAFVEAQVLAYRYHAHLGQWHVYESAWWSWPLMARPVWYAFAWQGDSVAAIWAIGNAVVWWASVPALLAAARAGVRGQRELGLVALVGLGAWVAWAAAPRSLTFMHYYLTTVPFACLALAALGGAWWQGRGLAGGTSFLTPVAARVVVGLASVGALAWFAWYWPLLTGLPLNRAAMAARVWFGSAWL